MTIYLIIAHHVLKGHVKENHPEIEDDQRLFANVLYGVYVTFFLLPGYILLNYLCFNKGTMI